VAFPLVCGAIGSCPGFQGTLALLSPRISLKDLLWLSSRPFLEVEYHINISGQVIQKGVRTGRVEQHCGLLGRISHSLSGQISHSGSILLEQGIVLDKDQ